MRELSGFEATMCLGFLGLVAVHLMPWIAAQCRRTLEVFHAIKIQESKLDELERQLYEEKQR